MAARNALWAPAHVVNQRYPAGNTGGNPDQAPSLIYAGHGILDDRLPYNKYNSANGAGVLGWYGEFPVLIQQAPSALTTTAIAAAQVPVAATPLTLVSSTGAGITVLATTFLAMPSLTTIPVGALAIDGNPAYFRLGYNFFTAFHDPAHSIARNVQIASVGNDSSATATVVGYDLYGYLMSETITLTNASTAVGKKAFKWIISITPAGTLSGSNVSVGQGDVYGLPIRADRFGAQLLIAWNAAVITANTGFVAAVTTTATTTTGDVRGTYAVQSASDATKRLDIRLSPMINSMSSNISQGLWGVPQA